MPCRIGRKGCPCAVTQDGRKGCVFAAEGEQPVCREVDGVDLCVTRGSSMAPSSTINANEIQDSAAARSPSNVDNTNPGGTSTIVIVVVSVLLVLIVAIVVGAVGLWFVKFSPRAKQKRLDDTMQTQTHDEEAMTSARSARQPAQPPKKPARAQVVTEAEVANYDRVPPQKEGAADTYGQVPPMGDGEDAHYTSFESARQKLDHYASSFSTPQIDRASDHYMGVDSIPLN